MPIDQYITVRGMKELTQLSMSECYRIARRIPGTVKIGRAVRIPEKGLKRFLEDRKLPASSAQITGINEIMERLAVANK